MSEDDYTNNTPNDSNDDFMLPTAVCKEFIEQYKNLPLLWDPRHEFYNNKRRRLQAYHCLLEILKKGLPLATLQTVKRQINSFRSNYKRALRRHLSSRVIIDGEEVYEYIPTTWKFHALRFLDNIEPISNYSMDEEKEDIPKRVAVKRVSQFEDIQTDPFIKYCPNIKKKNVESEEYEEFEYLDIQDTVSQEELNAIETNIALKLQRMGQNQRYHAELLINKVLINGLRNRLNDDTDISGISEFVFGVIAATEIHHLRKFQLSSCYGS